jgi:hypothetical protein
MQSSFPLIALCASLIPLFGQEPMVSYGFKLGAPLADAASDFSFDNNGFRQFSNTSTGRWLIGPSLELRLPKNFSVEANALHRRFNSRAGGTFRYGPDLGLIVNSINTQGHIWEFPVQMKYRLPGRTIRPFFGLGAAAVRRQEEVTATSSCSGAQGCFPADFSQVTFPRTSAFTNNRTDAAGVASAGTEYRWNRITLLPELRYMRLVGPRRDEVHIMIGFRF